MKEVTGEANMTIVAIVLIGALAAFAAFIINNMMKDVNENATNITEGVTAKDPNSAN